MERFLLVFVRIVFVLVASAFSLNKAWSSNIEVTDEFEIPSGAYSADFVRDLGRVAQIQFSGDYNKLKKDESVNAAARAVVGQEFYKSHADKYDMLIVFTDFDFDLGENVQAFNMSVSNKIQGINKNIYDMSAKFGSNGKLSSYIDMGNVGDWNVDPASNGYSTVLTTSLHEIMHQWVVGVHVMHNGEVSDIFIGQKDSHWSTLLDSDASVMYGEDWAKTNDGRYHAYDEMQRYSALDLYLAGFYQPDEVGTIHYIDSTDLDPEIMYQKGALIAGQELQFSINDIIAAEGKRVPGYADSQKHFKVGLIYLTQNTDKPDDLTIANLNRYAANLELRFAQYTGGRGFLSLVNISKDYETKGDAEEPDFRNQADTDLALYWLKSKQSGGYWQDTENTRIRDSATVNRVLLELDDDYSGSDYTDWAGLQASISNTDDAASLSLSGYVEATALVVADKQDDGGWGLSAGVLSSVFDTAAVLGINPVFGNNDSINFFTRYRNEDGGWPRTQSGKSETKTTAMVVYSFARVVSERRISDLNDEIVDSAYRWLNRVISEDSDTVSTESLAMILYALSVIPAQEAEMAGKIGDLIAGRQYTDGSWGGSVYATSMVVDALYSSRYANLEGEFSEQFPLTVKSGEPLEFSTEIKNTGAIDAGSFDVSLYVNSVNEDSLIATQGIQSLVSGSTRTLEWNYNAVPGLGNQRAILVINSSSSVAEKTLTDNQIFKDYSILASDSGVDIGVYASDVAISPSEFDAATEEVDVSADIRNLSSQDCSSAQVYLIAGENGPESILAQQLLDVAADSVATARFHVSMAFASSVFVKVSCEGDRNSSNDQARINLSRLNTFDAELSELTVDLGDSSTFGKPITVTASIGNLGTQTLPTSEVLLQIEKEGAMVKRFTTSVSVEAGVVKDIEFDWVPPEAGDYTLYAYADPNNLVSETDETNNSLSRPLRVNLTEEANLNILYSDIQYEDDIREGTTAEFDVLVRNTGRQSSTSTLAQLYKGKPFTEKNLLDEVLVPVMDAGKTNTLKFFWSDIDGAGKSIIYVVVDPSDSVKEADEDDNEAFVEVNVSALPDLYIRASMISFNPGVALPEKDVILSFDVVNVGGQETREFDAAIYLGGVLFATIPVTSIAAYSSINLHYTFAAGSVSEDVDISIRVDSSGVVQESDEDNNQADVTLVAGNSDLYVSQRYISPNGDGVKDYAQIYLNMDGNEISSRKLSVYDDSEKLVGQINAHMENGFLWYGTVNGDRLLNGEYALRLEDRQGNIIAEQAIIIDTDSTDIAEALDGDRTIEVFYENLFGEIAWLKAYANNSRVVFYIVKSDDQKLSPGIYTADFAGGGVTLVSLETAFEFNRSSSYSQAAYYIPMSLSADGYSIILESYGDSSYYSDNYYNYIEINLSTLVWNGWDFSYGWPEFYYNYYGTVYGIISGVLYSIDTDSGARYLIDRSLSDAYGGSYLSVTEDSLVDADTMVVGNAMLSFKDMSVKFYGDDAGQNYREKNIVVSEHKVAYVENGNLVISSRDGSDKASYGFYGDNSSRNIQPLMKYSSFSPDETKLMLYLPDRRYYAPGMDDLIMGYNRGVSRYINDLEGYVASGETEPKPEPEPDGYRVELDTKSGEYTLKSNFNFFASYVSGETGGHYTSIFADGDTVSDAYRRYAWNGYPLAFEGCEGGVYLSDDVFLDRSLYPFYAEEGTVGDPPVVTRAAVYEYLGSETLEFLPYAMDYSGRKEKVPFVTDFSFTSTRLLDNGFILFRDVEPLVNNEASRDVSISYSGCGGGNTYNLHHFNSLLVNTENNVAYLNVRVDDNNKGLALYAIAADKNFRSYTVQYRSQDDIEWNTLVASDSTEKFNEFVTTWVPDSDGSYNLRIKTEDLAGNVNFYTTSVVWNESANISSIKLDRTLFSPNFDDSKDNMSLSFKILRQANIVMGIVSEDGSTVLEKTYSYDDVGSIETIVWDGTDANRAVLADGLYTILLDGYRYYATIDTEFPSVENTSSYDGWGIKITATAEDENGITDFQYQYYQDESWGNISEYELKEILKDKELDFLNDNYFRVVASDGAGNQTISDQLQRVFDGVMFFVDVKDQEYPDDVDQDQFVTKTDSDGKKIHKLFKDLGGYIVLAYKNASDQMELNLALADYRNGPIDKSTGKKIDYIRDGSLIYVYEKTIADVVGDDWSSENYAFYVEDNGGIVTDTFEYRGIRNEEPELDVALYKYDNFYRVAPYFSSKDGLQGGYTLILSAEDSSDPYYSPTAIGDVGEGNYPTNPMSSSLNFDLKLTACSDYELSANFENGQVYTSGFSVPCLPVKLEPVADVSRCNTPSDTVSYMVCIERSSDVEPVSGLVATTAASISKINAYMQDASGGVKRYLFSGDAIFDKDSLCFSPVLEVSKADIDDGKYNIMTEFIVDEDTQPLTTYSKDFIDESYFPVVNLNSPVNGGRVCATSEEEDIYVTLDGTVLDYNPDGEIISFHTDSELDCTNQNHNERKGVCDEALNNHGVVPTVTRLEDESYRSMVQPTLALLHGKSDLQEIAGPKNINYWAIDYAGNMSCGSVNFTVDSAVDIQFKSIGGVELSDSTNGISPNGDGIYDDLVLNFTLAEDADLNVILKSEDGSNYELLADSFNAGDSQIVVGWENIKLNDGKYELIFNATDGCGFTKRLILPGSDQDYIEIDNTAPDSKITYPQQDNEVYPVTGIQLISHDPNIQKTTLSFKEKAATSWVTLKSLEDESWISSDQGSFYDLSLTGLDGNYQLRLYSVDRLGNNTESIVDLNLSALGELLSYYATDSKHFSPDGDGVLDSVTGRISVSRSADVTLKENDLIFIDNAGFSIGSSVWNIPDNLASDLPDGIHNLVVSAQDGAGTEVGLLSFIIDTIAPAVDVDAESDGRAGQFIATVTDENLDEVRSFLFDDDGAELASVLSGRDGVVSPTVSFAFGSFEEGEYTVSVSASDKAGHQTDKNYEFIYDVTSPVITLSEDFFSDVYINQNEAKLETELSYIESFPHTFTVKLGGGSLFSQGDFTDESDTISHEFDLSSYTDGEYELMFYMADVNDNAAEQTVNLILDSVAPFVNWEDNDFYIRTGEQFSFTVVDPSPVTGTVIIDGEAEASISGSEQSVVWPMDLGDGSYTVTVKLEDAAGNKAEVEQEFIQDTTAPDAVVALKAETTDVGADLSWTQSGSDDVYGYILYRDGEELTDTQSLAYSDTFPSEGTYTYYVKAYDRAGNLSDSSPEVQVSLDLTPPEISGLKPVDGSTINGDVIFYANVTADDIASVVSYLTLNDGNTEQLSSSAMAGGTLRLGDWDSTRSTGTLMLTVVAADENGNQASASATYTIDNVPLPAPTGLTLEVTDGNTVSLTWSAINDVSLAAYEVWRSGVNVSGDIKANTFVQKDVADGIYRYSVVSVDDAGNVSEPSETAEVTIDLHAPEIRVISPAAGDLFENALTVVAETDDKDVSSVGFDLVDFEGEIVLSKELTRAPFTASFDTTSLDYTQYGLIVTGVDANGNSAIQELPLEKADLTYPEPAMDVDFNVTDGNIVITWTASLSEDAYVYEAYLYDSDDNLMTSDYVFASDNIHTISIPGGVPEGDYYVTVSTYDENNNASVSEPSLTKPYHNIYPVFPYSPTSDLNVDIPVTAYFDGDIAFKVDGSDDTVADISANEETILAFDPSVMSGELALQGYYDKNQSTGIIPFLMEYGEKPDTPEIQVVTQEADTLTFELASSLADKESWFYTLNGHLENRGSTHTYRGMYLDGDMVIPVTSEPITAGEWMSGIQYYTSSYSVTPVLESIDVWNGVNWMRMPFNEIEDVRSNGRSFEFEHPVFGYQFRAMFSWDTDDVIAVYVRSLAAGVYSDSAEITIPDTDDLLSGISAKGINLTAIAISASGVIGYPSDALVLQANSDEGLAAISISVSLDGEVPVLSWNTSPAFYSTFYILHNGQTSSQVISDGTGSYDRGVYSEEGLNTYKVVGQTANGLMKASDEVSLSVTYADPDAPLDLTAAYDETSLSVALDWQAAGNTENVGYDVYRKHLLQQSYELIGLTMDTRYQDTGVIGSTRYQYYVVAVNTLSYPDHMSSPSNVVTVITGSDRLAFKPSLLNPYTTAVTESSFFTVRTASVPEVQLNLYANDSIDSSFVSTSDFSDSYDTFPYGSPGEQGDKSPYLAYYHNAFDLLSGADLDWISNTEGDIVYKGGDVAFVKNYWGELNTYYRNGSSFNSGDNVQDVDSDSAGGVLAFSTSDGVEVHTGDGLMGTIAIPGSELFASGYVAVAPSGQYIALMNGNYLWLLDISDNSNPSVTDISAALTGSEYDIYWLSDDRLMLESDTPKIINTDGVDIVSFGSINGYDPKVLGRYGNTLVVYYDLNRAGFIEGYSVHSGRRMYQRSFKGSSNFVTAYGQLCTPIYPDMYCSDLPGVDQSDVSLKSAHNEIHAESVFEDGTVSASSPVDIYRSSGDAANIELQATTIIRSLGRVSDIALSMVHRSGSDVSINGVTATIISPSGSTESLTLLNEAVTVEAGSTYDLTYNWTPAETGNYSIRIIMDAADEDSSDNRVDLSVNVVEKGSPSVSLALNDGESVSVDLSTLSWSGEGQIVATINSPVNDGRVILASDDFSYYEKYSYEFSPAGENIWLYDFTVDVALLDTDGNQVTSSSISHNGNLVDNRASTLDLTLGGASIVQGETLSATYIVKTQTLTMFNGKVLLSAVAENGTVASLKEIGLWYLIDGEVAKETVAIDTSELAVGSYKIMAELVNSSGEVIANKQESVNVTPAPVIYSGEMTAINSALPMNSECKVAVAVTGSVSNLTESLDVTLTVTGLGEILVATLSSQQLPYGSDVDISGACASLGEKELTLSVKPEARSGQRLAQITLSVVDTIAPVISFESPQDGDFITTSSIVTALVEDEGSGISSVTLLVGDDRELVMGSSGENRFFAGLSDLTDGTYKLQVKAYDNVGNYATSDAVTVIMDMTTPAVPLININDGDQFDHEDVTVIGTGDVGATFVLEINGVTATTEITDDGFKIPVTLADEDNTIRYWAKDAAGNTSAITEIAVKLVQTSAFDISANFYFGSKVLVLVDGFSGSEPGNTGGADLQQQYEAINALLSSINIDYLIVDNMCDFNLALQSDRFNQYLLLNESIQLDTQTLRSLWQATEQGDGLLLNSALLNNNPLMQKIAGSSVSSSVPLTDSVNWNPAEYSQSRLILPEMTDIDALIPVHGSSIEASYPLNSGEWQYEFNQQCIVSDSAPAAVMHNLSSGHVLTTGTDLALFATEDATWRTALGETLTRIAPVAHNYHPGDMIPLTLVLEHSGGAVSADSVTLTLTMSGSAHPVSAQWQAAGDQQWTFEPQLSADNVITRLDSAFSSDETGDISVQIDIYDADNNLLDSQSVEVSVTAESTLSELKTQLRILQQANANDPWLQLAQKELEKAGAGLTVAIALERVMDLLVYSESDTDEIRTLLADIYLQLDPSGSSGCKTQKSVYWISDALFRSTQSLRHGVNQ